ncbi:RrF2 family transcriptional regulator [Rhodoligotrophos defluvii]|uniref:RrF2 family transcriptional regulator n=1 Tax=Rhodoligotrophos defluvii TaxID=2561934 RepID=UPI0010CA1D0A|nr:Rrf2 family transcriptional regulator [Rhodoligotrophos defluvii]
MRLTKMTSYALRILIHCGQTPSRKVKTSDIAQAYQITEANVSKVVQLLVRAGLLETVRGPGGGLTLARAPEEIRIGDIIRATEDTTIQTDCFGQGVDECAILKAVPINRVFDNAVNAFIEVLDRHTLAEFIRARPGSALFAQIAAAGEAGDEARRPAGGLV